MQKYGMIFVALALVSLAIGLLVRHNAVVEGLGKAMFGVFIIGFFIVRFFGEKPEQANRQRPYRALMPPDAWSSPSPSRWATERDAASISW